MVFVQQCGSNNEGNDRATCLTGIVAAMLFPENEGNEALFGERR